MLSSPYPYCNTREEVNLSLDIYIDAEPHIQGLSISINLLKRLPSVSYSIFILWPFLCQNLTHYFLGKIALHDGYYGLLGLCIITYGLSANYSVQHYTICPCMPSINHSDIIQIVSPFCYDILLCNPSCIIITCTDNGHEIYDCSNVIVCCDFVGYFFREEQNLYVKEEIIHSKAWHLIIVRISSLSIMAVAMAKQGIKG